MRNLLLVIVACLSFPAFSDEPHDTAPAEPQVKREVQSDADLDRLEAAVKQLNQLNHRTPDSMSEMGEKAKTVGEASENDAAGEPSLKLRP
jgi:hypothetical protein